MPCDELTEVQAFGSDAITTATKVAVPSTSDSFGSASPLRHPVHLLARLPAFHSFVTSECEEEDQSERLTAGGAGGGRGFATSDVKLEETCCIVIHQPAFAKRGSLRDASDKDTVRFSYCEQQDFTRQQCGRGGAACVRSWVGGWVRACVDWQQCTSRLLTAA